MPISGSWMQFDLIIGCNVGQKPVDLISVNGNEVDLDRIIAYVELERGRGDKSLLFCDRIF